MWNIGLMVSAKTILSFVICFLFFASGTPVPEADKSYFNEPFKLSSVDSVARVFVNFNDTIPNDTLYICFLKDNPVAIYRDILSGVCLDGECRPVKIKVYWTITGRYLGYSLDARQELTKKEHVPFTDSEYRLLHDLLNDSLSVLANYSLEEITPKKITNIKTDGISGATPPNINGYIVPEAAYTTHTLWHLVYSGIRDSINLKVKSFLTFNVLDSLLNSSEDYDQLWALNHLPGDINFNKYLSDLTKVLEGRDVKAIEKSLSVIETYSDSLYQQSLFSLSRNNDYPVRKLALERLVSVKKLRPEVTGQIIDYLGDSAPGVIGSYLSALKGYVPSEEDLKVVSNLLDSSNAEVAVNAYLYLLKNSGGKKWLIRKLKTFENQKLKIED